MWTTLNEPWTSAWLGYAYGIHAPGREDIGMGASATHHLLLAHGLGVQACREIRPEVEIGLTLNLGSVTPGTHEQVDIDATFRTDGNINRIWLDPLFKGEYPADMVELYAAYPPGFSVVQPGDLELISAPIDFLGINYYMPGTVMGEGREDAARAAGYNVGPKPEPGSLNHLHSIGVETPGRPKTAMEWEIDAEGLREILTRINREYTQIPLYITENGAASHDYVGTDGLVRDPDRIRYIDQHLDACRAALDEGVNLKGYFIWSLLDNFEWGFGYGRRFGIVWVDYPTGQRIPKSSYYWYQGIIANNEVPDLEAALRATRANA
jgi:beta-glucosidase